MVRSGPLRLVVRHEQRVVAETMLAARRAQDAPRHFADFDGLGDDGVPPARHRGRGIRHGQCGGAAETGRARRVRDVGELGE